MIINIEALSKNAQYLYRALLGGSSSSSEEVSLGPLINPIRVVACVEGLSTPSIRFTTVCDDKPTVGGNPLIWRIFSEGRLAFGPVQWDDNTFYCVYCYNATRYFWVTGNILRKGLARLSIVEI